MVMSHHCGSLELNPCPLGKQPMVLTTDPSLQTCTRTLNGHDHVNSRLLMCHTESQHQKILTSQSDNTFLALELSIYQLVESTSQADWIMYSMITVILGHSKRARIGPLGHSVLLTSWVGYDCLTLYCILGTYCNTLWTRIFEACLSAESTSTGLPYTYLFHWVTVIQSFLGNTGWSWTPASYIFPESLRAKADYSIFIYKF